MIQRSGQDVLLDEAAALLIAGRDGEMFRARSPEHAAAWDRMAAASDRIDGFSGALDIDRLIGPEHPRARLVRWRTMLAERLGAPARRPAFAFVASMGIAMLVAAALYWRPDASQLTFATTTAQLRLVTLADGSHVTLGPRTAIAVNFSAGERRVRLSGGEAFFEVSRNPQRPFVVMANDAIVRVLGTKFNVNASTPVVRVAVQQGRVAVARSASAILPGRPEPVAVLDAGQQVTVAEAPRFSFAAAPPLPVAVTAAHDPGGWRADRRSYDDVPLAEVVADANRYSSHAIRLADPALGGLRVTTSFRSGQIEQMLGTLVGTLPVEIDRASDGGVLIRAAPGKARS